MEKKPTSSSVIGLIISAVLIVISLAVYFLDLFTEQWIQYVGLVVLFGAIIWAVINNGQERKNNVTFGNLFSFGFKVTAVVIVIIVLYTLLSGYIFPDMKEKIIESARTRALSNPKADPTQIKTGMDIFEKNYTLFLVIGVVFWYLILGVIASLIGAAVAKKTPASPFQNS